MVHVRANGAMVVQISQKHVTKRIYKTEAKWQKTNNNSTNYKHNCFKRPVLSGKSFHSLLRQLLIFNLFLLKTCFSIHNEVGESNEKNTRKDKKARQRT